MTGSTLSDKGVAVFAFAAYHQLTSGVKVTDVVLADGAGHAADPAAVKEIESAGLASIEEDRAVFTESGLERLAAVIEAIRAAG